MILETECDLEPKVKMFKKFTKKRLFLLILSLLFILWFLIWCFDFHPIATILDRSHTIILHENKQIDGKQYYEGDILDFDTKGNLYEYVRKLKEETTFQGILFPKATKIHFNSSGRIEEVALPKELEIQGIRCAESRGYRDHVKFYDSGKLKSAFLAESQVIKGVDVPKRLKVWFYESGKLKGITLAMIVRVQFDESGRVIQEEFNPDETLQVQGIKCGKRILSRDYLGLDGDVGFYEFGKLKYATLSEAQEIQGTKFVKLTEISFYGSGGLEKARLSEDQEVRGIKCAKYPERVDFHESGKLKHVYLSEDQEIQGNKCCKGDEVSFDEKGNITNFSRTLKESAIIQGVNLSKGDRVSFYGSGKLKVATISQRQEIQGVKFPPSTILFYESGELKASIPYRSFRINTILLFDENGKASHARIDVLKLIRDKRER